ncbi:MAG: hypothetical protein JWM98_199 [Thermoleophilia bacterium]|nr:hypothetical protein [Thermoleophilia bacterium]
MPIGYMSYSLARTADGFARRAENDDAPEIAPLAPGQDPLAALDPELRALVLSEEPAPRDEGSDFGERVQGALIGAGIGATLGFLCLNGGRRYQMYTHEPMNFAASGTFAAIGATIGGIAGFANGRSPLKQDTGTEVRRTIPAAPLGVGVGSPVLAQPR